MVLVTFGSPVSSTFNDYSTVSESMKPILPLGVERWNPLPLDESLWSGWRMNVPGEKSQLRWVDGAKSDDLAQINKQTNK